MYTQRLREIPGEVTQPWLNPPLLIGPYVNGCDKSHLNCLGLHMCVRLCDIDGYNARKPARHILARTLYIIHTERAAGLRTLPRDACIGKKKRERKKGAPPMQ